MSPDRARLLEILDAIDHIDGYTAGGRDTFLTDDMIRDATLYRIGSIGESVKGLSTPFRDRHVNVPWRAMAGMRDVVTHKYYGVDLAIVWITIERDLPALRQSIEAILASDSEVQA